MKYLKWFAFILAVSVLSSCLSMKLQTVSTSFEPAIAATAKGKSLAVAPAKINLVASRAEFDLRDVTVTIGGSTFALGGKYLEETNDMDLGAVGVVDTNIFRKAGLDTSALAKRLADRFVANIGGTGDFTAPINMDMPDAGIYSSRPVTYDFSQYPYTYAFDPARTALPPVFSPVELGETGADYVLTVTVDFRSDVYQILNDDGYIQNRTPIGEHKPTKGDYYLSYLALMTFKLTDAKTGAVVMTEKTKQAIPPTYIIDRDIYLPISAGNADAYAKYFRAYDFSAAANTVIDELANQFGVVMRPVYRNLNQYVKVEKK